MADKNKILIVDNDHHARQLVNRLLEKHSFETRTARDGLDALRALEAFAPDLLITDVTMPILDGLSLVKALKTRPETRNIPVIFLTTKSDPFSMIEGINVGAKYYVAKPFQADDLLSKVNRVLGGGNRLN